LKGEFEVTKKRILMLLGTVCLAMMLLVPLVVSCGPAAPEEGAEAELQEELAAEKAKSAGLEDEISDLEDEIAGLRAPGEVQKWEPATYAGAGAKWDDLVYMCDYITEMSDGRIVATPSQPGAVCPVEEQLDIVSAGASEAMDVCPEYITGKIPQAWLQATTYLQLDSLGVHRYLEHDYAGGRLLELYREAYAEYGDVYLVDPTYYSCNIVLPSTTPINNVDDLKGLKLRAPGGALAEGAEALDAKTVWIPSTELYTSLATGVIDGIIYSGVDECVALSLHEVAKYWVSKPYWGGALHNFFVVNGTVWNNLSDDLKSIVEAATELSSLRDYSAKEVEFVKGWQTVEESGGVITEWSNEDCAKLAAAYASIVQNHLGNDRCVETFDIISQFMVEMGYWE